MISITCPQLERERTETGRRRAVDGPAAAAGAALLGGQPGRPDRVDGELRRAVAAGAGHGRGAARRRLGRVGRLGAVHEDVRRRDGRARPPVRPAQAQHGGQAVRGPGRGGGRVQRAPVRPAVGPHGGRGAPATGRPVAQRGRRGRPPVDDVVRPAGRGRDQGRLAARRVRVAAQR